jgi:hypothetical protein
MIANGAKRTPPLSGYAQLMSQLFAKATPEREQQFQAGESGGIDQDELGVFERAHLHHRLLADGGTVTGVECHTVNFDRAFGRHDCRRVPPVSLAPGSRHRTFA